MTDTSSGITQIKAGLRLDVSASMGGKSVPAESRAFSKRKDLACKAGRKGGFARQKRH